SPADSGAIAAICQTLVAALAERSRAGKRLPVHQCHYLRENRWRAIRDGLEGTLIDPESGRVEPTRERLARLLGTLVPHGDELGCAAALAHAWTLLEANGAVRQREIAARHGIHGLLAWLADEAEQPTRSLFPLVAAPPGETAPRAEALA